MTKRMIITDILEIRIKLHQVPPGDCRILNVPKVMSFYCQVGQEVYVLDGKVQTRLLHNKPFSLAGRKPKFSGQKVKAFISRWSQINPIHYIMVNVYVR